MNERKTEALVRKHFEQFYEEITLEEQRSDNIKVDKLLKNASKKGAGRGYPEFIVTFKTDSDLIIVIECKANVEKHESKDHDKYTEYAVDGVLLYSSFLSKSFDVLAIAVSGQTKRELKVSHFLHLKNERKVIPMFDDRLLSPSDYLDTYLKTPEKVRQDYNRLLDFAKQLNKKLHHYKILESQRSLLISAILIALENLAFKRSYASHKKPENLAASLVQTVIDELETANISGKKLENLQVQFSFIKTDTSLSKIDNILKEIIDEIDENINSFIKTYKYFDVLGQLYIEFLRYANSDKGLGIVLTPPHITELFSDLAQVNKNSVVYDNCAGTGGFLISAMRRMVFDAKGDEQKISTIKSSQLIGTEYQAHIFALAVSNMYIHQDGKTNIVNGNCFDDEIINIIKTQTPTIGFLNPPYKTNKKTDTDELEFILNNLECLVDGGMCIAIVPVNCALTSSKRIIELRKKILLKHTLEAVLSMPNELFISSEVTVVTCAMIFTAHRPHPKGKETFFGYFKDDGFIKRKNFGRIDAFDKWNDIKEKWVACFINRKEEAGFTINKSITAEMEWLAENYIETDYFTLKDTDFEDTVLKYVTFILANKLMKKVYIVDIPLYKYRMTFNFSKWKSFALGEIFDIKKGKRLTKDDFTSGKTPFIGAIDSNNGYRDFIGEEAIHKGNTITVNYNGSVGEAFYQPNPFWASDDVNVLYPKFKLNKYVALFIITVIKHDKYRYNYGRKWETKRMKMTNILLPSKSNEIDVDFMEQYIKSLPYSGSI